MEHPLANEAWVRMHAAIVHRAMRCAGQQGSKHPPDKETARHHTVAITFSSIAIGVGRQLISKVVLHGGSFSKYSFHKWL